MPVKFDRKKRKWKIGRGKAMYKNKSDAERAYRAYLAKKYSKKGK